MVAIIAGIAGVILIAGILVMVSAPSGIANSGSGLDNNSANATNNGGHSYTVDLNESLGLKETS